MYLWRVRLDQSKPTAELIKVFSDHAAMVWRVQWNVTGTVLASSGDDGSVKTWRCNPSGVWELAGTMRPE